MIPVVLLLTIVVSSGADDICRYEFKVPRPAGGCTGESSSLGDRVARLEKILYIREEDNDSTSSTPSPQLHLKSLSSKIASLETQQNDLMNQIGDLSDRAVTDTQLSDAFQKVHDDLTTHTNNTETRFKRITDAVEKLSQSSSAMEAHVKRQLETCYDKLGQYKQELIDLKILVADAVGNQNGSRIEGIVQGLEDVKKNLYVSVGVSKARYDELSVKRTELEFVILNHTVMLEKLTREVDGAVGHIQITTHQLKSIQDKLENLEDDFRPKIENLEGHMNMVLAGQQSLTGSLKRMGTRVMNLTTSNMREGSIVKNMQTSLDLLSQRIIQITVSLSDQSSKVHDLGNKLEPYGDVEEIRHSLTSIKQNVYPGLRKEYNSLMELKEKVDNIQKLYKHHLQISRNNTCHTEV